MYCSDAIARWHSNCIRWSDCMRFALGFSPKSLAQENPSARISFDNAYSISHTLRQDPHRSSIEQL